MKAEYKDFFWTFDDGVSPSACKTNDQSVTRRYGCKIDCIDGIIAYLKDKHRLTERNARNLYRWQRKVLA